MQQRKIILFFIILFIASSFWLFYQNEKKRDPNFGGEWWAVYFASPKDNSLNFSIENHSNKTDFHWEILADSNKIQEGDAIIFKGENINLMIQDINSENLGNKKISVKVSTDGEAKEIYKNL